MPNHITNYLIVEGSKADVERFQKENRKEQSKDTNGNETVLSFDCSVPDSSNDDGGWYSWRIKNWGTKWNAYEVQEPDIQVLSNGNIQMEYSFDTAWSPPAEWLKIVAEKYANLAFELKWYDEDYPQCGKINVEGDNVSYYYPSTLVERFDFIEKHFPDMHDDEYNTEYREECINKERSAKRAKK